MELADGGEIRYRGVPHRLTIVTAHEPTRAEDGRVIVSSAGGEDLRKRLLWWLTSETESVLRELVPKWTKTLALRPHSVTVRLAKTRWGSCTSRGDLYFNSRVAMLSPDVAQYLVVHELCHLKRMDHSAAFWAEVEAALPGARALRAKLRQEEPHTVI